MVAKSSVNENKEYVVRVLRGHPFSHESGRGEVASVTVEISPSKLLFL
jgi:hypothetical protein